MVALKGRKRRRSQAFRDEVESDIPHDSYADASESAEPPDILDVSNGKDSVQDVEIVDAEKLEKEQSIWDAFREEYYEALEQLPLSLHRAFALIKELDTQVNDHSPELLSTIQAYLQLRESMTKLNGEAAGEPDVEQSTRGAALPQPASPIIERDTPGPVRRFSTRSPVKKFSKSPTSSRPSLQSRAVSTAASVQSVPQRPQSTLLLTKIARMSEDLVRATSEKVNVARFAYDLVNRHIKDLDRAIKEQETSISLGLRPGTHPASFILPELVVPKSRGTGAAHDSPPDSDEELVEEVVNAMEAVTEEVPPGAPDEEKTMKAPRKKGRGKYIRKTEPEVGDEPEQEKESSAESRPTRNSRSLKLTVPPMSALNSQKLLGINSDEPRYCYCNQVSYGEMIGCDGEGCQHEWFHIGCLGLEQIPSSSSWFCPDCQSSAAPKRRKGR